MKLRPRKGTALILPESVGPTSDVIIIPDHCKNRDLPDRGKVVAMSGKPVTKKGVVTEVEFQVGDRVIVRKFTGVLIDFYGTKYFSVPIHEILAVLT